MSFQPVLPVGGYGGWRFLNRTLVQQQDTFSRSPALKRDTEYFREKIAGISTAEDLVADRRLLRVALGAFGLDTDLDSRFFIRKVLEEGVEDRTALANRLADRRYRAFAEAFGLGGSAAPGTHAPGFGERIALAFERRQFEVALGQQDETMRLALGLQRDLVELAEREMSDEARWFAVMGTPPLRRVFETAFGLPTAFGALDIDQQHGILRARARQNFGENSVAQFADPEKLEALTRRFLLRATLQTGPSGTAPASIALQLLQAAPAPLFSALR